MFYPLNYGGETPLKIQQTADIKYLHQTSDGRQQTLTEDGRMTANRMNAARVSLTSIVDPSSGTSGVRVSLKL